MAGGPAVGVDVPGVDAVEIEGSDVDATDGCAGVGGGEVGGDWVAVDADGRGEFREGHEVAADAAAEVGDSTAENGGGDAPARWVVKRDGFVAGDPFVGGLFQAEAGEEHSLGVGKLCRRAAAEFDLLQQQMRLCLQKIGRGGGRRRCAAAWRLRQVRQAARRPRCPLATRSRQARYKRSFA